MPQRSGFHPHRRAPRQPWLLALLALSAALAGAAAAHEGRPGEARVRAAAAALATVDTVRLSCPDLQVDAGAEARLIAASGLDRAGLRKHPAYRDQAVADFRIRFADGRSTQPCDATLTAHDAIAPGLIRRR